jgi:hypothetical protein
MSFDLSFYQLKPVNHGWFFNYEMPLNPSRFSGFLLISLFIKSAA